MTARTTMSQLQWRLYALVRITRQFTLAILEVVYSPGIQVTSQDRHEQITGSVTRMLTPVRPVRSSLRSVSASIIAATVASSFAIIVPALKRKYRDWTSGSRWGCVRTVLIRSRGLMWRRRLWSVRECWCKGYWNYLTACIYSVVGVRLQRKEELLLAFFFFNL